MRLNRRQMLSGIAGVSGTLLLGGLTAAGGPQMPQNNGIGLEVTAVEDLMREHGVLRRILIVYSEATSMLSQTPYKITPASLRKTAQLFRSFGEDYHEMQLEETHIFTRLKKYGGLAENYINIFLNQHQRGRQITDYILNITRFEKFETTNAYLLATALNSFVRMYRAHTAQEDTVIFPVWKQTLTADEYDELSDRFEEIEHQSFGEDGFEKAVRQISSIEQEIGISDLASFTAPPPGTG